MQQNNFKQNILGSMGSAAASRVLGQNWGYPAAPVSASQQVALRPRPSSTSNFNNFGLDNNGLRYGDRTFPFFKEILGFDNVPKNFWERRDKYPNLTINDEVFISFVGDFTLDFGPIVTLLFFLIISIIIYRIACLRNSVLYFHHLILIHLLIYVCSIGSLKLFPFSDISGNLKLSVYVISYFIFKYNRCGPVTSP